MTTNTSSANAEGMSKLDRRALLVGGTAAAVFPVATTAAKETVAPELPVARVNRIAFELSRAMDEWMLDVGYDGKPDHWVAHVHPFSTTEWPVSFEHLHPVFEGPSLQIRKAIDAHKAAEVEFCRQCNLIDRHVLGRNPSKAALKRHARAGRAERHALKDVIHAKSFLKTDRVVKASYLLELIRTGTLGYDLMPEVVMGMLL